MDSFDPCLSSNSFYFLFPFFFILLLSVVWVALSGFTFSVSFIFNFFIQEFSNVLRKVNTVNFMRPLIFFVLVLLNLLGFIPYIFSLTRHALFTCFVSLILVLPIFINIFFFNRVSFIEHLTPKSCPRALIFVIVLIELVSILIRPVTLILRLAANIIAGHVISSLIRGFITSLSFSGFTLYMSQFFIILLETGVCSIQGYVFGLLFILYLKDCV